MILSQFILGDHSTVSISATSVVWVKLGYWWQWFGIIRSLAPLELLLTEDDEDGTEPPPRLRLNMSAELGTILSCKTRPNETEQPIVYFRTIYMVTYKWFKPFTFLRFTTCFIIIFHGIFIDSLKIVSLDSLKSAMVSK